MKPRPPRTTGAGFPVFGGGILRFARGALSDSTGFVHARFRFAFPLGLAAGLLALTAGLRAQGFIPDSEALYAPTHRRLEQILGAAARDGWAPQSAALHQIARRAYEQDRLAAAGAWMHLFRWSSLLGTTETVYVPQWGRAIQEAQVGHPNMAHNYEMSLAPLSLSLDPACQAWAIEHPEFSDEFFATIEPVDYLPEVFRILSELYRADPARFQTYAHLALAIALVYDVPPPPHWPHSQVTVEALPRQWPRPLAAFDWWSGEDRAQRTYLPLTRLAAEELKFVVDAAAPFDDLAWSQQIVNYPLEKFGRTYSLIKYRQDRNNVGGAVWPGRRYSLADILGQGGICIDQAYFAAEAGKARGVPTLIFRGEGNDARHAWFGYLDGKMRWQLDAGRGAGEAGREGWFSSLEPKLRYQLETGRGPEVFVTGVAFDPQTWRPISDHELQFLAERFHALPSYQQSRIHAEFAGDYLVTGEPAAAVAAARKAVNYERRNQSAWELLLRAEKAAGYAPKQIEATLYEAIMAFGRYPDLEAYYSSRVGESLRARGETSAADNEQRRIAQKYRSDRRDLSVMAARDMLLRSMGTQPLEEQIRTFNRVLDSYGRNAGIMFFDQVVVVFVQHLAQLGHPPEAMAALDRARTAMKVQPGGQLDQEFAVLARLVPALGRR